MVWKSEDQELPEGTPCCECGSQAKLLRRNPYVAEIHGDSSDETNPILPFCLGCLDAALADI
jgi:hypothetical protein